MVRREIVEFNGIKFVRYPDSNGISRRRYYYPFVKERWGRKISALHREVWYHTNGEIPEGYDIHHIDGDFSNNSLENLECVSKKEHSARHPFTQEEYERQLKYLEKGRLTIKVKGIKKSEEKLQEQREKLKLMWDEMEYKTFTCSICGREFKTKCLQHNVRFCSQKCYVVSLRGIKHYNETKKCEFCGKEYKTNTYRHQKYCSLQCAGKANRNILREDGKKMCTKCREIKTLDNFGKDKKRPDGLYVYCKQCRHEIAKEKWKVEKQLSPKQTLLDT